MTWFDSTLGDRRERRMLIDQGYINHIVLVLDASYSMAHLASDVVKVADGQIQYLAQRSKELDQETRVTVYLFNDTVGTQCVFYDKDVLRLPSLRGRYHAKGNTPLIDATVKAIQDLSKTATLYGDHAFLVYVLTDGQENRSLLREVHLRDMLSQLPENWTIAALVPDQRSVFEAKKFGFSANNISVWDATNAAGVVEVGERIKQATETFMQNRAKGVRGTKEVFRLDVHNVHSLEVRLDAISALDYALLTVPHTLQGTIEIRPFVETQLIGSYRVGQAYYELIKPEKIQAQKRICILDHETGTLYGGEGVRSMLGLPNSEVLVHPDKHPRYAIFVQSTSVNRKLLPKQRVVVMK
jgi:Mg-chelatase subunit ChlD